VLASFNGSNGQFPLAGVTLVGNTLYGTTGSGGNLALNNGFGYGTVFSVPLSGDNPTVLASFSGSNGSTPGGGVTLVGNTLYGTTLGGGANSDGTVYSLPLSGDNPTVLASLNGSNGENPARGVMLDGSTLYGTTEYGGAFGAAGDGTVYSLPLSGGNPTVLASFNGSDGALPLAGLTLSPDGDLLYRTTMDGGASGEGTVFSLPLSGGTPTVLASFTWGNGANPWGGLTLSADGNTLFGTTMEGGDLSLNGGHGDGTVFALQLNPTPEPSALALLSAGGIALVAYGLRQRKARRKANCFGPR
jgi:uncharacterized repeat protein (TIGR03803 family)